MLKRIKNLILIISGVILMLFTLISISLIFNNDGSFFSIFIAMIFTFAMGYTAYKCFLWSGLIRIKQRPKKNVSVKAVSESETYTIQPIQPVQLATNTTKNDKPSSRKEVAYQGIVPLEYRNTIPNGILQLLWFKNGPMKNYTSPTHSFKYEAYGEVFTVNIETSFGSEPSCIDFTLPIGMPESTEQVSKLGYFPSYQGLDPYQRYTYLNWLKDPVQPIDLGYAYLFYYGLERHLLLGDFEPAFDMTMKLLDTHRLTYAYNALIFSSILRDRTDKLLEFTNSVHFRNAAVSLDTLLIIKYVLEMPILPIDIINNARQLGFTNTRYIKSHPDLFIKTLENRLIEFTGSPHIDIAKYKSTKNESTGEVIFANYSFAVGERTTNIPKVLTNTGINTDLYKLLSETHEDVKVILRKGRKSNTAQKAKIVDEIPDHDFIIDQPSMTSKKYSVNSKEVAFLVELESFSKNQKLHKTYTYSRMSNGSIDIRYNNYPIGKINLQGNKAWMMYMNNLTEPETINGNVDQLITSIPCYTNYIKKHL